MEFGGDLSLFEAAIGKLVISAFVRERGQEEDATYDQPIIGFVRKRKADIPVHHSVLQLVDPTEREPGTKGCESSARLTLLPHQEGRP